MPFYDFGCACGQVTERREGYGVTTIPCPSCGNEAQRLSVYHVAIQGDTVARASPYQYAMRNAKVDPRHLKEVGTDAAKRRFAEQRQELKYNIDKKEQEVESGLPGPNAIAEANCNALGIDPHAQSGLMRKEIQRRATQR